MDAITSESQITGLTRAIRQLQKPKPLLDRATFAWVTLVLVLFSGAKGSATISAPYHFIGNVVIFKPVILFSAFIGAISISCRLFTAQWVDEIIGMMHIARSEWRRFNKAIFVHIGVGFKAIGVLTPAIRSLLFQHLAKTPHGSVIRLTIGEAQAHAAVDPSVSYKQLF